MNKTTLNRVLAAFTAIFIVIVILDMTFAIPFERNTYVRMAVGLLAAVVLSLNETRAGIAFCCVTGLLGGFIDSTYSGAAAGALLAYAIAQVIRKAAPHSEVS
jgi:hypothetical protein